VWAAHRPWLAVVAALALVGYIAARNVVASWRHRFHATDARLVAIAPPPEVDPAAAAALWANLAGILTPARRRRILHGVLHVVFQYAWTGRQLLISIWIPGSVPQGAVEAAVRGAWPGAATTTVAATDPIPATVGAQTGGHLLPLYAEWLPLRTDHDADSLRALMAAGSQLHGGRAKARSASYGVAVLRPTRSRQERRGGGWDGSNGVDCQARPTVTDLHGSGSGS
jgi:hypothetical protein